MKISRICRYDSNSSPKIQWTPADTHGQALNNVVQEKFKFVGAVTDRPIDLHCESSKMFWKSALAETQTTLQSIEALRPAGNQPPAGSLKGRKHVDLIAKYVTQCYALHQFHPENNDLLRRLDNTFSKMSLAKGFRYVYVLSDHPDLFRGWAPIFSPLQETVDGERLDARDFAAFKLGLPHFQIAAKIEVNVGRLLSSMTQCETSDFLVEKAPTPPLDVWDDEAYVRDDELDVREDELEVQEDEPGDF
jgi:hypothetical protein